MGKTDARIHGAESAAAGATAGAPAVDGLMSGHDTADNVDAEHGRTSPARRAPAQDRSDGPGSGVSQGRSAGLGSSVTNDEGAAHGPGAASGDRSRSGRGSSHAHGALAAVLRRSGLKLTPQRHLICRLIENSDGHPTAEELYESATSVMPSMSLKTVYTTLNDLAALNAIRLVNVGTGGFRVESNLEPHGHLVCRSCGAIIDIPVNPAIERELAVPPDIEFQVEQREVTLRGLCRNCASKQGEGARQ